MKRQYIFLSALAIIAPVLSLGNPKETKINSDMTRSLRFLATQKAFDFKTDPNQRERLKKQLEDPNFRIGAFDFDGMVLEDLDLSGFNLSGIDFSGCTFNRVNLSNSDLTDIRLQRAVLNEVDLRFADLRITLFNSHYFTNCKFYNVNLEGVLLYGDKKKDFLYARGKSEAYNLIGQYSDLMKKLKNAKLSNKVLEVELLEKHAQCFHNLFTLINLNLREKDLTGFNLTGLDFQNVILNEAELQDAWLSENVQVPKYKWEDRTPLFDKWLNGTEEEKRLYQNVLNSGGNFFKGVDINRLRTMDWRTKDLRGADFSHTDLRECNLSNLNLKNCCFSGTLLAEPRFIGSNLQGAILRAGLRRADFTNANLRNARMSSNELDGTNLTGACLENLNLKGADLSGLILLPNYNLPTPCEDETLINIYNSHPDSEVKAIIKQIIKCRGLEVEN